MKKTVTRITALLLSLLLCTTALTGCGSEPSYESSEDLAETVAEAIYEKLGSDPETYEAEADTDTYDFPSKFDLRAYPAADGRTINVVSAVQSQDPWGSCWSFGTISACESSLMSQWGIDRNTEEGINLSELHLAYFAYDCQEDDLDGQEGEGAHFEYIDDISSRLNAGGGADLTASVLANGIGPVLESEVPYENITGAVEYDDDGNPSSYAAEPYSGWSVDENLKYNAYAILSDTNFLPSPAGGNEAGIAAVKSELMKGHGVSIGYMADSSTPGEEGDDTYFNYDTWAQCVDEENDSNHEVCIVGWDDDFPAENFAEGHIPEGNGAWIVKNSWGAEVDTDGSEIQFPNAYAWGIVDPKTGKQTGYFYLSYYDMTIDEAETYDFAELSDEGRYDYEELSYDYMPYDSTQIYTLHDSDLDAEEIRQANVFRNNSGETISLTEVSYTTAEAGSTVNWEVYVYDGEISDAQDVLDSQDPDAETEADFAYRGFHRVPLDEAIEIAPDQCVIITAAEQNGGSYVLGFAAQSGKDSLYYDDGSEEESNESDGDEETEEEESDSGEYFVGVCNQGESLLCIDGQWIDWADVISGVKALTASQDGYEDLYAFDNLKIKGFATYVD